ncbi:sulfatase-like hydrolase/transferase [Phaeobacter inhibens]|uniref:sulfatase-like hydrolase/transferase n=1 Tax=Phaeobacter inhibens TaxID=221822 RepID=UPI0021A76A53|nr:sulfatase-like hydrolase/transferase [Phaeobacter inhibens]UWR45573.1 sulfatase-like hydrolase/transferase [Phaeobacter inhibens]UWR53395.1 sulfatase-like hydrolase/transferase [Phaeobacter inhibens]UWR68957.1 sulfatase-like hydrolase/transferase [Phaeobacter inhibens]UWR72885.1 sulfatase-like hydrolase/transferase [Phaeobacter inhibens]UWR96560.1 sulfatase-like hydrolase/transferase [Phaeobacter inhibens]
MNILYIMFDQLRFDYLSCAGHPHLQTPHIDGLAKRGVRFTRAYVQSPTCGSSRMSSYTGRYPSSHGVQFNGYPLRVGEWTMGDHLRKAGMSCHLIGKTHMVADAEGLQRLGLAPDSLIGVRQTECGFDPFVRDDGLWAEGPDGFYDDKRSPYNEYLKSKGYPGENPWSDFANAGTEGQDVASGWFMVNADKPANIAEEDSETPWLTREAMRFIEIAEQNGDQPWCAHLSYIKPHWPYIVPAPYHDMYDAEHVLPAVRSAAERQDAHPVFEGMMNNQIGQAFSRDEVRQKVIPAYMGLIKQADDQMGHLFAWLEATGRMQDTMIVLTSDHGDYLGDHWMGEKNLFHEPSIKVPLIIYDPRGEADATRGTTCDEVVEAIDLLPTFLEAAGGEPAPHILEGRSLMPWLRGEMPEWRDYAVAEFDYATLPLCEKLGLTPKDARLFMVVDKRWKFMHAEGGLRPMLFDLQEDPDELVDLAKSGAHQEVIDLMYDRLLEWGLRMSQRITLSDTQIAARRGKSARKGILLGVYEPSEVDDTLTEAYRRPIPKPTS